VVSICVLSICAASGEVGSEEGQAQGDESDSLLAEELRWLEAEGMVIEIPTVVGASRFEQSSVKAPASVSVVTRDQIKKYGYRTLAELLRSLRGFTFNYDRTLTLVGVRGFNHPEDLNTRVLVMVDGHRINDNLYDSGLAGTDLPLDIDLIERVEVVRGPISALYGSNAFLALINIITREPADIGSLELCGSYGSFDAMKGRLTCGHVFENGPEFMISGTFLDSQGPDELYFPEFDDPATNNGIAEHNGDKDIDVFGKVSLMDFTLSGVFGRRDNDDPTGQFGTIFNDPLYNNRDAHWYLDLNYQHVFGEDWDIMARLFYDHYRFDWIAAYGPPVEIWGTRVNGEWWGTELVLTKPLLDRHTLTAGLEFRDNFRQDFMTYVRRPYDVYAEVQKDSEFWALFAQDQFEILDNLILNAGVRYDRYSSFGGTLNPRAALVYNPFTKTILKFLYGEAFRAPTAYELFYDDPDLRANPDLDPETIRTFEIVAEQYLGKNYRIILAGFRNDIDDVITVVTSPDRRPWYVNEGSCRSVGFELEVEAAWENGIEGRVGYCYQDAWNEGTGAGLINSPRQLGKANLALPVVKNKLFYATEVVFVDDRKTFEGNTAQDYWLTNVTLYSASVLGDLEFSVGIYNLFNKHFDDVASEDNHAQDVIRQDGRTFRVEATYRF